MIYSVIIGLPMIFSENKNGSKSKVENFDRGYYIPIVMKYCISIIVKVLYTVWYRHIPFPTDANYERAALESDTSLFRSPDL